MFENKYSNVKPSDFSCAPDRPTSLNGNLETALSSGRLPLQNHFLYYELGLGILVPDVGNVSNTNAPEGQPGNLGDAAAQCASQYDRAPAFLLLDFANVGDPIVVVDRLNGVSDASGRTPLPTETPSTATATSRSTTTTNSNIAVIPTTTIAQTPSSQGQASTTSIVPTSSSAAMAIAGSSQDSHFGALSVAISIFFGLSFHSS